jgi:DNA polymerase III subunit beta
MKLQMARDELLRGMGRVQAIVDRRGTLPILTNALLEASDGSLKLAATDLEVGVTCHQPAQVSAPGRVTIGAKKLYEIVRELEDSEVELEARSDARVEITAGKARFSLLAISPEEYPTLPSDDGVVFAQIDGSLLADMIDRTLYATSTDETRYNLNGILVELTSEGRLCFVATDGHRLAKVERSTPQRLAVFQRSVIVPRKGVSEIRKLCDEGEGQVEIGLAEGFLLVRRPGLLLSCRLIDSEYPAYRQVLPVNQQIRVNVERERLVRAVRRVALVASDRASGFAFALEDNELQLSASNPDLGEAREHLAVEYPGPRFQTRFDARYVAEALQSIPSKEVLVELIDELSPAQLRPADDPGQLAVIMPMRL